MHFCALGEGISPFPVLFPLSPLQYVTMRGLSVGRSDSGAVDKLFSPARLPEHGSEWAAAAAAAGGGDGEFMISSPLSFYSGVKFFCGYRLCVFLFLSASREGKGLRRRRQT